MSGLVVISLDLGTTSIKAGLLYEEGALDHVVARPAPETDAGGGRYESDALAYVRAAEQALEACLAQAGNCRTLGLSCQRSSFLIWERGSGQPVTPLISWQDNRGAASCAELRAHEAHIRELTGLPLTPYYFAPKLRAVLQANSGWRELLERGELLAGTLDAFLIWRWSSGRHFATDASMAARTLLMDIRAQQCWSPELCGLFGIPMRALPQILSSAAMNLKFDNGMRLQASMGDQSAAMFAGLIDDAEVMVNLGTGGFVVRYLAGGLGPQGGYLKTLVYRDSGGRAHVAAEGTLNSIAAALAPYPVNDCKIEDLAENDILCIAEPSGVGAPYFRNDLGLMFSQPAGQLMRRQIAALLLEGIIFRVALILEDFQKDAAIKRVYLSGGLSGLACLRQGIASCVPFEVWHLRQRESSLHGAALLAAGMPPGCNREAEAVLRASDHGALPEKYRRWKEWFDTL